MAVLEGVEREKAAESSFKKLIAENFPNLGRDMDLQVEEVQRTSTKITKITMRHIIIKMLKAKDKERILKAARKK